MLANEMAASDSDSTTSVDTFFTERSIITTTVVQSQSEPLVHLLYRRGGANMGRDQRGAKEATSLALICLLLRFDLIIISNLLPIVL